MRRRHHTFQFSVFTFQFNMRRRHHTFHFSVFTFQFVLLFLWRLELIQKGYQRRIAIGETELLTET